MKRFCIIIALILSFAFICGTACAATAQTNPPDDAALEERANEVLNYLSLSGESAYNKIYRIYNYMAQSVEYDWAATGETGWDGVSVGYGQTAYEALCLEKAVCAGIAKAVTYLLDKVNIPCKTVSGLNDGVSHAWNVVKLGNSWYYMDATSDLGTAKYSHFLKTFSDLGDYELSSASASEVSSLPLATTSYSHEETDALFETAGNYLINPGFGNVTIHSYTGTQKNVVIPATINSRPVKRLVQYFIYENDTMETLTISEGIESIEHLFLGVCTKLKSVSLPSTAGFSSANSGMFQGGGGLIDHCDALETISVSEDNPYLCVVDNVLYNKSKTSIICYPRASRTKVLTVPDGVVTIQDDTFAGNPYLEEVILPDTVEYIGYWAFNTCSALKKVNIPESCTAIGEFAFNSTALTSIHIPASVTHIGYSAFNASSLAKITVDPANPDYYAVSNTLISRGGTLMRYAPKAAAASYTVPSGVTVIGQQAFYGAANLEEVIVPDGVTTLMDAAFMNCSNLVSVTLPETLTEMEDYIFSNCYRLGRLVLPASLTTIPDRILGSVSGIVIYVHSGSAGLTWAEQKGFAYHIIGTEWDVSGDFGSNAAWTLDEDGALTVTGSGSLSYSGDYPPWDRYSGIIRSASFSEGITSLPPKMFIGYYVLRSVHLPLSLEEIPREMFNHCPKLEKVIVWDRVSDIDPAAFSSCAKLKLVVFADSYAHTFAEDYNFPYQLIRLLTLPAGLRSIGSEAFRGSACEAVIIPDGCTSIGSRAFAYCPDLLYVRIPSSVRSIAADAFEGSGAYLDRRN